MLFLDHVQISFQSFVSSIINQIIETIRKTNNANNGGITSYETAILLTFANSSVRRS
jgi:hypothetical protein